MAGFFVSNDGTRIMMQERNCIYKQMNYENFTFECSTLNKFLDDKVFMQNDKYVVILEGVILNKKELFELYCKDNIVDLVIELIEQKGREWISHLRGSFNGLVYSKKNNECHLFVDQVGDKPIFYFCKQGTFFAGSSVEYIVKALQINSMDYTYNEEAMYQMLSYGYMISDDTLIENLKRVSAGCGLLYSDSKVAIKRYHRFFIKPDLMAGWNEEEIIEKIDQLFKKAVKLEYDKDHEYGYRHISALSGGLDSRMNVWVANEMGHDDMLNITFGQSDCLDEKIAKNISANLGTDLLTKNLDNGKCLLDFREIVRLNNGLSIFWGAAHEFSAFSLIDLEKYGIYHTGQVGDAIVGSKYKSEKKSIGESIGAYSRVLTSKVNVKNEEYENEELFFLYNRGFRGALNGQLPETNFTEVISPFLYVEFLEFCLNVPLKYRYNHYIYKKWIMKKYPEAAKIPVERFHGKNIYEVGTKEKTKSKKYFEYIREKGLKFCFLLLLKKLHIGNIDIIDKNLVGMNPVDLWYDTQNIIRTEMDKYSQKMLEKSKEYLSDELVKDMEYLYRIGNASEKCQVITVLAFIEVFQNDKENIS